MSNITEFLRYTVIAGELYKINALRLKFYSSGLLMIKNGAKAKQGAIVSSFPFKRV